MTTGLLVWILAFALGEGLWLWQGRRLGFLSPDTLGEGGSTPPGVLRWMVSGGAFAGLMLLALFTTGLV